MSNPIYILVVDDDAGILSYTVRLLEKAGYSVGSASSGEEALESVRVRCPDLLLLDYHLPGFDGVEVCRQIKQDHTLQHCLVVIVSALTVASDEQAAGLESGADGYIGRPIANRELLARVNAYARVIHRAAELKGRNEGNHHRLEVALAESKSMLHAIFDSSSDLIWSVDSLDFGMLAFNAALREYFLLHRGVYVQVGDRPEDLLASPESIHQWHGFYHQALASGTVTVEYEDPVGKGSYLLTFNPLKRGQAVFGVVVFCKDITEFKQAQQTIRASLEEKEALLKEIHHRVKNNLQIISSLLSLQSNKIDNSVVQDALLDTQNRLLSMALIHESLYVSGNFASVDFAAYLKQLCRKLCRTLVDQPGKIQLHLDLAPVHLGIDQAIPCGLIVNELVSNAFKHGFPDERSGEVRIELVAPNDGRECSLRVTDNGVGLPPDFDPKNPTSLGLELVSVLVGQIGGQLEIGPGPGAAFEIKGKKVAPGR